MIKIIWNLKITFKNKKIETVTAKMKEFYQTRNLTK